MGEMKMSKKEVERVGILERVSKKELSQKEGEMELGLSVRQIRRLIKRIKAEGISGICHGNRGKESGRKTDVETIEKVVSLYRDKYGDFGVRHFQEKIEGEGIKLSRETIRQYLIKHGLWHSKKIKRNRVHTWRERRASEGELIQIDGSHHRWLEDRLDQSFCLMGYIDDATSKVYGRFYEYEGVMPILDSMKRFIQIHGVPVAVYVDRHSTYKVNRRTSHEEDLAGEGPYTQFEFVMKSFETEVIHARSPQAKGRVERLFRTLQDRLVKEMRLANISTIEDANVFLETFLLKHNEQFSVTPKAEVPVYRSICADFDYHWTFAIRETRKVHTDYTIRFKNRVFLIQNPSYNLKETSIQVLEALNGDLRFSSSSQILSVREITESYFPPCKPKKAQSMAQAKKLASATVAALQAVPA